MTAAASGAGCLTLAPPPRRRIAEMVEPVWRNPGRLEPPKAAVGATLPASAVAAAAAVTMRRHMPSSSPMAVTQHGPDLARGGGVYIVHCKGPPVRRSVPSLACNMQFLAADATGLQRRPVTFLEYAVRIAQPAAAPVFVVLLARARRVVDVARSRHRRWRRSEERLFIHIRAQ